MLDWPDGQTIQSFELIEDLGSGSNYLYFTTEVRNYLLGYADKVRFWIDPNTLSNVSMNDITFFLHANPSTEGFDDYTGNYLSYRDLSSADYDWTYFETGYASTLLSNGTSNNLYFTVRVKAPDSYPSCGVNTQFKISLQKNPTFGSWHDIDSAFLRSIIHTSNTSGTLNGTTSSYPPSGIQRSFLWDESINLDLSSSTCESRYTLEIVETNPQGTPLLEYGTQNWKNGASQLTFGQAPSNIDLRSWTGGGSSPIVQNGEGKRYYRVMVATYPSWDPIWFFFRTEPVDCDYHYLIGPEHVYNGISPDASEALHNAFKPAYMTDPDNWLPYTWQLIKLTNTQIPSQGQIYFTYGGATARLIFGPNDVGSLFQLKLSTNCPYDSDYDLTLTKNFIVEEYGSGLILNTNSEDGLLYELTEDDNDSFINENSSLNILEHSIQRINSENQGSKVLLFPNPVSRDDIHKLSFNFSQSNDGTKKLEIYNLTGKLIHSDSITSTGKVQKIMLRSNLEAGIYLVNILDIATKEIVSSGKLLIL